MKAKLALVSATLLFLAVPGSILASTYGVQTKTSHCTANAALPDSACTPGAVLTTNTKIICVSGYAKAVRDVLLSERKKVFAEYGISYALHANYEVDHLIGLELGGSNDIANLWPEAYAIKNGSKTKDVFENYLHKQVCNGSIAIQEAQREIATNWLAYAQQATSTKKNISIPPSAPIAPVQVSAPAPVAPTPIPSSVSNQQIQKLPSASGTSVPIGATAQCADGTYSYSQTHRGTCSHHGGVMEWTGQ